MRVGRSRTLSSHFCSTCCRCTQLRPCTTMGAQKVELVQAEISTLIHDVYCRKVTPNYRCNILLVLRIILKESWLKIKSKLNSLTLLLSRILMARNCRQHLTKRRSKARWCSLIRDLFSCWFSFYQIFLPKFVVYFSFGRQRPRC